MADTSERIIILSFILLMFIAIQSPNDLTRKHIGTLNDIEVEIHTSHDEYLLGEDFTATVYLVNNDPYDIWISTPNFYMIDANSLNNPEPLIGEVYVTKDKDSLLHIPANSSVTFDNIHCYPQYTGEFQINCVGGKKTVLILEPEQGVSVGTWGIEDLLYPELALSHGFKGYVNISYVSETPVTIIVSPGKVINYTIQLKLIPHVPEFIETEVLLAPENERAKFGILSSSGANLNEYIHYSPNGFILLRMDEPRNVTMILSVPEGLTGISESPGNLFGVGIWADVPIASAYGAGLHRIPRNEYAWVTATILTVEPSPTLNIIELSSEDKDIPRSLFEAIDKALLDAESVQVEPSIYPHESRRFAMPIDDAESILRYFGEDIVEGRNAYEFYVGFLDYVISILIQFSIQVTS